MAVPGLQASLAALAAAQGGDAAAVHQRLVHMLPHLQQMPGGAAFLAAAAASVAAQHPVGGSASGAGHGAAAAAGRVM